MAGAVEESTSKRAAVANRIFLLPLVKPILKRQMSETVPLESQLGLADHVYYGKVMKNERKEKHVQIIHFVMAWIPGGSFNKNPDSQAFKVSLAVNISSRPIPMPRRSC